MAGTGSTLVFFLFFLNFLNCSPLRPVLSRGETIDSCCSEDLDLVTVLEVSGHCRHATENNESLHCDVRPCVYILMVAQWTNMVYI